MDGEEAVIRFLKVLKGCAVYAFDARKTANFRVMWLVGINRELDPDIFVSWFDSI